MRKYVFLTTVIIALILTTGCVSKSQYAETLARQEALTAELAEARTQLQSQQQTLDEMTAGQGQLQSALTAVKAQLDLEKKQNAELTRQAQKAQEGLKAYRDKVAETYASMESNYSNFVSSRSSSATTFNLITGQTIPSADPVLSAVDKELLAIWRSALARLSQMIEEQQ